MIVTGTRKGTFQILKIVSIQSILSRGKRSNNTLHYLYIRVWKVEHESPEGPDTSTHHIGLSVPMKWIPSCKYNNAGYSIHPVILPLAFFTFATLLYCLYLYIALYIFMKI